MRRYSPSELEDFLLGLDRHLIKPFTIVIIGGGAAALAYNVAAYTYDIDTMNDVSDIEESYIAAKKETGLKVPFGPARVADAPYNYESRLQQLKLKGLKRLNILVPEKHDLVLMKVVRGYENDLSTIEEIAVLNGLDFNTLVSRYILEMSHVIGDPRRLKLNFLAAIERVFGEDKAELARSKIEEKRSPENR
jgi:hypothetical protein